MSSVEIPLSIVCLSSAAASDYTYRKDLHSQCQLSAGSSTLLLLRYSCGELAIMGTGRRASSGSSCYTAQAQDLSDSSKQFKYKMLNVHGNPLLWYVVVVVVVAVVVVVVVVVRMKSVFCL